LSYALSFYGLIGLIAIIPFYISAEIDLRSLRIFRLFRLAQSFKLIRYSKAMRTFAKAFVMAKEEFILFGILTLMLLYLSAVGIYYFEHIAQPEAFKSIFHSLWWGVTTLTTVGYGDVYPVTLGERIFTFCILVIGLGVVAIPAGIIASSLTKTSDKDIF
jgi:voltage-gated potassium channel